MRIVPVVDGTAAAASRQARMLDGFLRGGLQGMGAAEAADAVVFCRDAGDRERLVAAARDEPAALFLFAGDPAGNELATRLAVATGGSVLTGALSLEVRADRAVGRRLVYSGHLTGRFALGAPPWCVSVDPGWADGPPQAGAGERRVVADARDERATRAAAEIGRTPAEKWAADAWLEDVEVVEPPATSDLEEAAFVVVAGKGAGGRDGVERIAAAAGRMGAAFGVTRPVAMNGWAPMDRLIGVSGTRAAPALCLVAGAYGAPAFVWGIERAGLIVAVTTDEHAPIVAEADVAVLDDGVAVVEALADIVSPGDGRQTTSADNQDC